MSVKLDDIVSLCKRRGFIYQGSEIYGGLAGTWDYGPLGVALKRNIVNAWLKYFVDGWDDMYLIDSAILMNQKVWQASGHVNTFHDPLVECSNCHMRYRADKIDADKCPNCGRAKTFGKPRLFNMMFKTNVGPVDDESSTTYLRAETAQGMFTNFKNIVDSFQPDLPFGLAQVGRAFRNEISPRDFLFRTKEFEIMEFEFFIKPDEWEKNFEKWHKDFYSWFKYIGLPKDKIKEIEVPASDRAHYSKRTIDFHFDFPSLGYDEIAGLAYRTDFDLKNHQKVSGKNLEYRPKDGGKPFIPHVIEPTWGLDRHVLAVLANAYSEDMVGDPSTSSGQEKRIFLKLPDKLAPVKVAVFPLLKNKPELVKKAREVYKQLKKEIRGTVMFDDNGNIGKRYRRQDEIGTPYCVTIDFQTLEDNTVTLRNRDTTEQKRCKIEALSKATNGS
ncbi:glycine--tRNA ligase [Candidatus Saccharibacteria bacterium]|nr:glycine--tRNA ligase [Candidatus Saccharibacteria bacterium]